MRGDDSVVQTGRADQGRRALLLDTDLFFSVKVTDTLKYIGYQTRTVRTAEAFTQALSGGAPAVSLVNTNARGVDWRAGIRASHAAGVPVIAFGSHVDLEIQRQAREAGATSVIANSKLASDLPGVVARALHRGSGQSTTQGGGDRDATAAADEPSRPESQKTSKTSKTSATPDGQA
jgi:DNA-binding NtrC family response regulator